ncbi:unnamed protein product [Mucor hiemalis]
MVKKLSLALICLAFSSQFALGAVMKRSSSDLNVSAVSLASQVTSLVNNPTPPDFRSDVPLRSTLNFNIIKPSVFVEFDNSNSNLSGFEIYDFDKKVGSTSNTKNESSKIVIELSSGLHEIHLRPLSALQHINIKVVSNPNQANSILRKRYQHDKVINKTPQPTQSYNAFVQYDLDFDTGRSHHKHHRNHKNHKNHEDCDEDDDDDDDHDDDDDDDDEDEDEDEYEDDYEDDDDYISEYTNVRYGDSWNWDGNGGWISSRKSNKKLYMMTTLVSTTTITAVSIHTAPASTSTATISTTATSSTTATATATATATTTTTALRVQAFLETTTITKEDVETSIRIVGSALPPIVKLVTVPQGTTTVAEGTTTVAEGTTTVADGTTTIAEGTTTVAEGTTTVAEGTTTVAEGTTTVAEGTITVADGTTTIAAGTTTIPEGTLTVAAGTTTVAEGTTTVADGTTTIAAGTTTIPEGTVTVAEGTTTVAAGTTTLESTISVDKTITATETTAITVVTTDTTTIDGPPVTFVADTETATKIVDGPTKEVTKFILQQTVQKTTIYSTATELVTVNFTTQTKVTKTVTGISTVTENTIVTQVRPKQPLLLALKLSFSLSLLSI